MSRHLLLFVRGVLLLLERRRRRLAQPPSGPAEVLRLLLPLLPHGAAASEPASASDSIVALLLAAALRRLPRAPAPAPLTFDGLDMEEEGARQLLLRLALVRIRAGRAPIHAGDVAMAPQHNVLLELYHEAVAGGLARRLLLAPQPAGPGDLAPLQRAAEPEQEESEAGTTLLAVLFTAGIRRLPRAPPLAVDLDDTRAVEVLVGVFIERVRAAVRAGAVAVADAPTIHEAAIDIDTLIFNSLLHRARRVAPPLRDNAFALRVLLRLPARTFVRLLPPPAEAPASLLGVVFYVALRRVDAALPLGSDGFLRDFTDLIGPFSRRILPPPSQDDHTVLLLPPPPPAPAPLAIDPCPTPIAAEVWRAAAAVRAARTDTSREHIVLEPDAIDDELAPKVDDTSVAAEGSAKIDDKADEDQETAKVVILSNLDEAEHCLDEGSINTGVMVDVPPHLPRQEAIDIDAFLTARGAPSSTLPRGPVLSLLLSQIGKL